MALIACQRLCLDFGGTPGLDLDAKAWPEELVWAGSCRALWQAIPA